MIEVRPVKIVIIAVAISFLVYHVPAAIDMFLMDDREAGPQKILVQGASESGADEGGLKPASEEGETMRDGGLQASSSFLENLALSLISAFSVYLLLLVKARSRKDDLAH